MKTEMKYLAYANMDFVNYLDITMDKLDTLEKLKLNCEGFIRNFDKGFIRNFDKGFIRNFDKGLV